MAAEGESEPSLFVAAGSDETTAMDRAVLHNPTVIALIGLLLRCCVGLHPHSGQASPPAYGDFEAQRRLLQTAARTPLTEIFGDYPHPPLNALSAKGLGSLAQSLVPNMMAGDASTGYEGEDARAFMHASVLLYDVVMFFSATWFFCILFYRSNVQVPTHPDDLKDTAARFILYSKRTPAASEVRGKTRRRRNSGNTFTSTVLSVPVALVSEVFLIILLQPALVLVDHGHFQYTVVFLGLTIWVLVFCMKHYYALAAVVFSLAASYNQVAMHYLPAVGLFLLWNCKNQPLAARAPGRLAPPLLRCARLVGALAGALAILWLPFCDRRSGSHQLRAIARAYLPPGAWPGSLLLVPSCYDMVRRWDRAPRVRRLVWALFNCSLTLFLFSREAHDLAVLLPLLPAALLAGEAPGPSCWFSIATVFSLSPLLREDRLGIPAVVCTSVFAATSAICFRGELCFLPLPWVDSKPRDMSGVRHGIRMVDSTAFLKASAVAATALLVLQLALPGSREALLVVHRAVSAGFMFCAWLYGNWYQWMLPAEEAAGKKEA